MSPLFWLWNTTYHITLLCVNSRLLISQLMLKFPTVFPSFVLLSSLGIHLPASYVQLTITNHKPPTQLIWQDFQMVHSYHNCPHLIGQFAPQSAISSFPDFLFLHPVKMSPLPFPFHQYLYFATLPVHHHFYLPGSIIQFPHLITSSKHHRSLFLSNSQPSSPRHYIF